jgi:hypothetical protein
MLDNIVQNNLTFGLALCLILIYLTIIIYLLYYFFKHRKVFNSLLDLDIVLCDNHSILPEWITCFNILPFKDSSQCYEFIKNNMLKKCKTREHAKLKLLNHYLQEILNLCKSCNIEQYVCSITKYIWLVQNTLENFERIYIDEDTRSYKVYMKISNSYDYLINNCNIASSEDFMINVKIEDIQYLEKMNKYCDLILDILEIKNIDDINDNSLYILGLFTDILCIIKKLKDDIDKY